MLMAVPDNKLVVPDRSLGLSARDTLPPIQISVYVRERRTRVREMRGRRGTWRVGEDGRRTAKSEKGNDLERGEGEAGVSSRESER